MQQTRIVVKISLGEDLRRLTIEPKQSWDDLQVKLHQLFQAPQGTLIFKYKDDEEDSVLVSSDAELSEAIRISQGVLRFHAFKKQQQDFLMAEKKEATIVEPTVVSNSKLSSESIPEISNPEADKPQEKKSEATLKIEEQLKKFIALLELQAKNFMDEAKKIQQKIRTDVQKVSQEKYQEQISFCKEQAQKCISKIKELKNDLQSALKKAHTKIAAEIASRNSTVEFAPTFVEGEVVLSTQVDAPASEKDQAIQSEEVETKTTAAQTSVPEEEEEEESSSDSDSDTENEPELEPERDEDLEEFEADLVQIPDQSDLLQQLAEMGFSDQERNAKLLKKNNGDLLETIKDLVD